MANRLLPVIEQMAIAGVTELPLLTVPLSLHTNSAFAREEALPIGSTKQRDFEILGQAQAKVFVSVKEGPKFFKHNSCRC